MTRRSRKLPAIMFYPGDWMKDPALRASSLYARGLWIDLLCLMHESPSRGYLLLKTGKPMGFEQISRVTGITLKTVTKLVQELIENGVCDVDAEGVLMSRRMIRDESERDIKSQAGKRGGRVRVANEREARRKGTKGSHDGDDVVELVWEAIPAKCKKSKPNTCQAISEAIERYQEKQNVDRRQAGEYIKSMFEKYYNSAEGKSKYHRGAIRWLDEDGFMETLESWNSRKTECGAF